MKLSVECYAGHKADERPVRFWLDEKHSSFIANLLHNSLLLKQVLIPEPTSNKIT